jgi:peptidylprolyl isomerase
VLLIVPPDASAGTGSDGNGTQAIVVDILGIDNSSTTGSRWRNGSPRRSV